MDEIKTTFVPKNICPNCKKPADGITSLQGFTPNPGDFIVCAYCSEIGVFTSDMTLRLPTEKEIQMAEQHPGLKQTKRFTELFRRYRKAQNN